MSSKRNKRSHKRKESPMLIMRKCPECAKAKKSKNMLFIEGTRIWVCESCGYSERQLADDGMDDCRFTGKMSTSTTSTSLVPRLTEAFEGDLAWRLDEEYGDAVYRKGPKLFDPNPKKPVTGGKYVYVEPHGCGHDQQRIKVGAFEVWATESCRVGWSGKRTVKPDFGVYLSTLWMDKFPAVFMNDASCGCLGMKHPYPALFVDWVDKEGITLELYGKLVGFVIEKLGEGHTVEIGCQGAHGRTGTLIAGVLGKLEGLEAAQAIGELRARYCKKAVESKAQVELIRKYLLEAK